MAAISPRPSLTDPPRSPRVAEGTPVVDCGVADLQVPPAASALELTEFLPAPSATLGETIFHSDSPPLAQPPAAAPASPLALPQPRGPGLVRRLLGFVGWSLRSLFGIASLILLLAFVAAVPVVNLLALGYLLDVEGRVARSGRIRDAFPLIDLAPRLGSIALGLTLWLFPLTLLASAAADARLIDPGSPADVGLHLTTRALAVVIAVHLCLALARGGSLGAFFRPIRNARWLLARWWEGDYWTQAESAVRDFVSGLQLKRHFWLGLRGYIGAMAWLVIPTALFAATTKTEGGPILVTLVGGALLMLVLSWIPFLQAHFAAEDRFGAMFELRTVRALYRFAPFSWMVTLLVTLTLALPMYLFKVALPPRDAMWLVTIVFIVSIYPVKVITGWAYHRAATRERRVQWRPEQALEAWRQRFPAALPLDSEGGAGPAPVARPRMAAELLQFQRFLAKHNAGGRWDVALRWVSRLVLAPLLALYVFLLFFTQFIGEHGKRVLFEHHAFLLPGPF